MKNVRNIGKHAVLVLDDPDFEEIRTLKGEITDEDDYMISIVDGYGHEFSFSKKCVLKVKILNGGGVRK